MAIEEHRSAELGQSIRSRKISTSGYALPKRVNLKHIPASAGRPFEITFLALWPYRSAARRFCSRFARTGKPAGSFLSGWTFPGVGGKLVIIAGISPYHAKGESRGPFSRKKKRRNIGIRGQGWAEHYGQPSRRYIFPKMNFSSRVIPLHSCPLHVRHWHDFCDWWGTDVWELMRGSSYTILHNFPLFRWRRSSNNAYTSRVSARLTAVTVLWKRCFPKVCYL